MEHTTTTVSELRALIQIIPLAGAVPFVRVGANDPLRIKQALKADAQGIIVPMVCSPEETRSAVEAVYDPPRGKRGVDLAWTHGHGATFADYRARQQENLILLVQIDHYRAVEQLDEIMAVDGVDGFVIGPYDLSRSLGVPGDLDHPKMNQALQSVARYAATGAKPAGVHVVHSNPSRLQACIEEGYRFRACGADVVFLLEKLQNAQVMVAECRPATEG